MTLPKIIFPLSYSLAWPIRRCKGLTVSQKKPMTPDMLLSMKKHLNLADPVHANFWAICLVGFFGPFRKANMLLRSVAKFNPLKNFRRGDIIFFPAGWVIIVNRWSKTIQFTQRVLTIPLPQNPGHLLCSYTALQHAFKLVPAPLSGPAFVIPATSSKGLKPFMHGKFDSILKLVASRADLAQSRISGHSLRAGGGGGGGAP